MAVNKNLALYNAVRDVPQEAQRTIKGGNLNGFTDINPMWRIQMLTEQFGMCGFGWYTEITKQWMETAHTGEVKAFCEINLYIKMDGKWSKPIVGTGGSSFVSNFSNKVGVSDECYKMAYTDALSVACKALGFGADIYWSSGRTKYCLTETNNTDEELEAEYGKAKDVAELNAIWYKYINNKTSKDVQQKHASIYQKKLNELKKA